ncbi:siderophore ABC transporter substrate-binding protein [Shimia sp. MMG029]|uniref:siderophore ABC transporter substrate-binding protein n=1 Tax=Shimia sp. MMG029 TaxID=3021978 RepID=UPI0022FF22B6|nr:siderophore ABC transporter substrate-binding protein [Shimia sp. MMG029]MDA5558602.1 siderophore ABC transporter substrate-binding protein [Shimia sp. MMG029]
MLRAFVAALALSASVVQAAEIETAGGKVTVENVPAKIAVFDIAAIDTLTALEVPVAGAPEKLFVDYLSEVSASAETIGNIFEPDFEAVNALQPDLIIVGGRSSSQGQALTDFGQVIDMTIWKDTVGEGLARLEAYGELYGKQEEAAALKADFEAKLAATKAAVADQGTALVLLTNGPKISAYGSAGRFGWIHKALGLPEAVADVEQATHGEAVSFEFIKDANPDILIVIDRLAAIGRPGDAAAATLDNALVAQTNAWKNGKVVYLNAADVYVAGGGIQSMNRTLDLFLNAMNAG